jgi:hypothetical protein
MAVAAAVLVALAAGGTFVSLQSGGDDERRVRHGRFSGALDAPGEAGAAPGDAATVPETAGGTGPAGGAPAGAGGAPGVKGAPGTTAGGAAGATGDSTSTSQGVTFGSIDAPRTGPSTATSTPGSGKVTTPSSKAPGPAGWGVLPEAPIDGRAGHTAIWTGKEMVIWGGSSDFDSDPFSDGAAFDPATRTWRMVPAAPIPPRYDARAFWTGREMLIYGGSSVEENAILDDGGAWDPATNRWRAVPASPLGPRDGSVVTWAGDRLIVWGGSTVLPDDAPEDAETELKNDGAAYVPATNSWVPVPAAPIVARTGADSVWTGTRFIVTGGYHEGDEDDRLDGAAFDPLSGAWTRVADRPTPGSCGGGAVCEGHWTGKVALFPVSGVVYDPAADRWSTMAAVPAREGPAPGEPVVWTGQRLISWGISGEEIDDPGDSTDPAAGEAPPPVKGAAYDPVANRWQAFATGPLSSRVIHTAVWTGDEMLVWGGTSGEVGLGDGAAYRPE